MDFKVLITDSAISDLKEIVEFVAQDDPAAAGRLGEKLVSHALSLGAMPARFPLFDKQRSIRKMSVPPYLIFYQCDENALAVYILHIWHGARTYPSFN
jgi:toxin ParE1/3/4